MEDKESTRLTHEDYIEAFRKNMQDAMKGGLTFKVRHKVQQVRNGKVIKEEVIWE